MMEKAKQFFCSDSVRFFSPHYENAYDLICVNELGYDPTAPCLFIGMYRPEDHTRIESHKGKKIVLWMGSDASNLANVRRVVETSPEAKHISISRWIQDHLVQFGVQPYRVNLPNTDIAFWSPVPAGKCVYCYAPNEHYGLPFVKEVIKRIKYEVILTTDPREHTPEQVRELYGKCFIGLRATKVFDGSPASVNEMGLMGRPSLWNGGTHYSIPFDSFKEVEAAIDKASALIGSYDANLATYLHSYFDVGTSWLWC